MEDAQRYLTTITTHDGLMPVHEAAHGHLLLRNEVVHGGYKITSS